MTPLFFIGLDRSKVSLFFFCSIPHIRPAGEEQSVAKKISTKKDHQRYVRPRRILIYATLVLVLS
jgi:hypothetical protein